MGESGRGLPPVRYSGAVWCGRLNVRQLLECASPLALLRSNLDRRLLRRVNFESVDLGIFSLIGECDVQLAVSDFHIH